MVHEYSNKTLELFANMMINKIQQVSDNWRRPWFTLKSGGGTPQNLSGRSYNGMNSLMLLMQCEEKGYKFPVFMTFLQAKEQGAYIRKGEKSFPIVYWGFIVSSKKNPLEKITIDDYRLLSQDEKSKWNVKTYLRDFLVFNIEQTTLPEVKPELWEKLKNRFSPVRLKDVNGMFASPEIDRMLNENAWICKINITESDSAYFYPIMDSINIPLKGQFIDGESFYSTLLHEMAHSTGTESRLNRVDSGKFGGSSYAKEELVAELTAALAGQQLGISSTIREGNAQYLKGWLSTLKEEPSFILTLLSDVNKASAMIGETVLKQDLSTDRTKGEENGSAARQEADVKAGQPGGKFSMNDIPRDDLKRVGINCSDLSKTNLKQLLEGKETSTVTVTAKDGNVLKKMEGKLSLQRNPDSSVSLQFRPVVQLERKTGIKR